MLNYSCYLDFRFAFFPSCSTKLSIEDFLLKYLAYVSQLEAEALDPENDLHKAGTWRIVVRLDTVDYDELERECVVDMSDGYDRSYLVSVINYVCTVNAAIPLKSVDVTIFLKEEMAYNGEY